MQKLQLIKKQKKESYDSVEEVRKIRRELYKDVKSYEDLRKLLDS